MALRNIDHFIETTEHHIGQLINIATELEGAREVPGILYSVYYLTRAKEAAEKVKENKENGHKNESGAEDSTSTGDGTTASTQSEVQSTGEAAESS